jgi:hypothetical protein
MNEEQSKGLETNTDPAPVDRVVMPVEGSVVLGWTWFGIGMVRFHVSESSWYTMWMLFLTNKFAVGFHVGGVSRSA